MTNTYTISEIVEITNSGFSYLEYHCTPEDDGYLTGRYDFIEGIGHPTDFVLFPNGGGNFNMIGWEQPQLTYVTDGEDNHVIYEAAGGSKLWEQAGIEEVTVDKEDAQPEWYDLRGVKIAEPSTSGVYIRRSGSHIEKVVR